MKIDKDKKEGLHPEKSLTPMPQGGALQAMSSADAKAMYGDLDQSDIIVPSIVLLQGLSPEVSDGLGKPGYFFIKGLSREIGKEIEIIPILRSKSRIRWKPLQDGGGILCRSFNGRVGQGDPGGNCDTCTMKEWGLNGEQPSCDMYENVVAVLRQDEDWIPMAVSGSRTKLKALKGLNTLFMAEQMKGRPLFAKSYTARVVEKSSQQNMKFFSYQFLPGNANQVLPEAEIARARAIFDQIKGKNLQVMEEQEPGKQINNEI